MRPLVTFPEGSRVRVGEITGGRGVKTRLEALGIVPGALLEVVKPAPGPVVVKVNGGARIALGFGEAMKVYAEEVVDGDR